MGHTVSDYFSDEDLIAELRTFFDEKEMYTINFKALLNSIEEHNDIYLTLKIKNKTFYIDKISGDVTEKGDYDL